MSKASVVRALHDDAEFSELFTTYLLERNIRVQEDLVEGNRPDPIVPKINLETIAEMSGTAHSHVNHFMNKFRAFLSLRSHHRGNIFLRCRTSRVSIGGGRVRRCRPWRPSVRLALHGRHHTAPPRRMMRADLTE
jgi:hypothetical protein